MALQNLHMAANPGLHNQQPLIKTALSSQQTPTYPNPYLPSLSHTFCIQVNNLLINLGSQNKKYQEKKKGLYQNIPSNSDSQKESANQTLHSLDSRI